MLVDLLRQVDYTGFTTVNVQRFGQKFVGKVANPQELLLFSKAAARAARPEAGDSRARQRRVAVHSNQERFIRLRATCDGAHHCYHTLGQPAIGRLKPHPTQRTVCYGLVHTVSEPGEAPVAHHEGRGRFQSAFGLTLTLILTFTLTPAPGALAPRPEAADEQRIDDLIAQHLSAHKLEVLKQSELVRPSEGLPHCCCRSR